MSNHHDREMEMVDHLAELRRRILYVVATFLITLIVGFIYVKNIYQLLVDDVGLQLTVLGPSEILWVYLVLSAVAAVVLTIPIAALQAWLFVKPALLPRERKMALLYIPALFILFILGLCFGYFIVRPMVFEFLTKMGEGLFSTMYTAENYFQFVMNMTLPFAVLFELPIVVMFLTSIGLLNPYVLVKARKMAYFALVIIAVTITPPDFISDFLVTIPLLFLYEVSISISKIVHKRREKRLAQEAEQWDLEGN